MFLYKKSSLPRVGLKSARSISSRSAVFRSCCGEATKPRLCDSIRFSTSLRNRLIAKRVRRLRAVNSLPIWTELAYSGLRFGLPLKGRVVSTETRADQRLLRHQWETGAIISQARWGDWLLADELSRSARDPSSR